MNELKSLEELAREKEIREFRKEAALRILCAIGDRIVMPEWKRDAVVGIAVQYADTLIKALEL